MKQKTFAAMSVSLCAAAALIASMPVSSFAADRNASSTIIDNTTASVQNKIIQFNTQHASRTAFFNEAAGYDVNTFIQSMDANMQEYIENVSYGTGTYRGVSNWNCGLFVGTMLMLQGGADPELATGKYRFINRFESFASKNGCQMRAYRTSAEAAANAEKGDIIICHPDTNIRGKDTAGNIADGHIGFYWGDGKFLHCIHGSNFVRGSDSKSPSGSPGYSANGSVVYPTFAVTEPDGNVIDIPNEAGAGGVVLSNVITPVSSSYYVVIPMKR